MKLKKLIQYGTLSALVLLGASACDSGFKQLNQDPNNPTHASAALVIPYVEQHTSDELLSRSMTYYVGALWAQQTAEIQYADEDRYDLSGRTGIANAVWDDQYANILENLKKIKESADKANDTNLSAVAEILMAYNYQNMVDLWGPIPYSQALEGDNATKPVSQPAYDTGKSIYTDLISQVKKATASISGSSLPFSSQDMIYSGNALEWKKFGGSLLLRLYIRLSKADPATAAAGIKAVLADPGDYPVFSSNSDNAEFHYVNDPYGNPLYLQGKGRVDFKISATMVDTLEKLNDPRLRIYAQQIPDPTVRADVMKNGGSTGNIAGFPYQGVYNSSASNSLPLTAASGWGAYFYAPNTPGFLMTYPEVLFIEAEAAARGWTSGNAETLYNNAIKASFDMFNDATIQPVMSTLTGTPTYTLQVFDSKLYPSGLTTAEANAYLSNPGVKFETNGTMAGQLHQIALQRWIALYPEQFEAWVEWRRMGMPYLKPNVGGHAIKNQIPIRLHYPILEQSVNSANYKAAVTTLGGPDDLWTPVFWEK